MEYIPSPFFSRIAVTTLGKKLWHAISSDLVIEKLIDKANSRRPAVEAIDQMISSDFGKDFASMEKPQADQYKKMIGHMVGQIMKNKGYSDDDSRELHNCTFFTKGHLFVK